MTPLPEILSSETVTEPGLTPVVVCTNTRGVFFGDTPDVMARPITLYNCRICYYWAKQVGCITGLSDVGPVGDSKIGASARSAILDGVTAVFSVTPEAEKTWRSAPVNGR